MSVPSAPDPGCVDGSGVPGGAGVEAFLASLADPALGDAERVDRIRFLEDLKSRACAAQARLTVDLDVSQRDQHAALGIAGARQGRGVASLVAAARRESPFRGSQHLGLAGVLVREMPHLLTALEHGVVSEWRATIVARETACLSLEDRQAVDAELFADAARVVGWGDKRLAAEARKVAYRLDPHAAVARARRAEADRRVTVRPAPDTMVRVTALLPAVQGIAVWATLSRVADELIGVGDGRSRGQIMADTLVERVTGQAEASAVPMAVSVTVSDATLFGVGTEPAWVTDYGPVPSGSVRDLIAAALAEPLAEALTTLRRLWVNPLTGQLVTMESKASAFPAGLGAFIDTRDQTCRTPWCDAPVRHRDHIRSLIEGGETTDVNGQGLCEQCNYAKEAPGWRARPATGPPGSVAAPHTVVTVLPTGHSLTSVPPDLPRPSPTYSRAEIMFRNYADLSVA